MSRILEKYLPVNKSSEFDRHDDPDNDDFVKANEKGKFVPIEDVAEKVPNEDEKEDQEEDEEEDEEEDVEIIDLVNPDEELAEVRNDIESYNYNRRGPANVSTESFHVDHDNKSFTKITGEGETKTEDGVLTLLADDENEAMGGIAPKRSGMSVKDWDRKYKDKRGSRDNLKTKPDNKIQRDNRGLLRKIIDNFSSKN